MALYDNVLVQTYNQYEIGDDQFVQSLTLLKFGFIFGYFVFLKAPNWLKHCLSY
jgi:hypothetical protein